MTDPIYLTADQLAVVSDRVILDPDPPWREQVGRIPGRSIQLVDRVEDSTPFHEGWLSSEEIALAIAERYPGPWVVRNRVIFDALGHVVIGETCGAPSYLVANWIVDRFNKARNQAVEPHREVM